MEKSSSSLVSRNARRNGLQPSYSFFFKTIIYIHLRNRKHFPCFYRVIVIVGVSENEKCCGNTSSRRVFPQLFRVLPNLHECFYNSIETQRKCFLFLLENNPRKITKKERKLDSFIDYQNVDSLHHAMYTRHLNLNFFVFLSSFSINLQWSIVNL